MPGPWEDFQDRPSDIRVSVRPNAPSASTDGPWADFVPPLQNQQQPQTQRQQSVAADPYTTTRAKADEMTDTVLQNMPIVGTLFKALPRQAVEQGLAFGFSDEIKAGLRSLFGDNYENALNYEREKLNQISKESPVASVAGEVTGALLTTPFLPAANVFRGANVGSRAINAAVNGGVLGGVYGFGAGQGGVENRLNSAINTGAVGALTGGIGAPVVEGIAAGARSITRPFRGLLNPEQEAQRRVSVALATDNPNVPNFANRAADTLDQANASGIPLTVADAGGETTRALARSAANTSPPARTALNNAVNDRFEGQGDRISNVVRSIVGGDPNAPALRQQVQMQARQINNPAYRRAYAEGQNVWDEALADLAQAPDMQTAIRTATIRGNNQAAANGFEQVRNPFITDPNGKLVLRDGVTPNLQFWDAVKQNLDKINTRESQFLARALRDHLDTIVPSYRTARAGAAAAFDAQDALEAGQRFASSSMPIKEARIAYQRLSNAERQLFANGFASDLLDRIAKVGDRRNVINSIFQSADSRERLALALGPRGAQRLESAARVENIMDMLRSAVQGSSTTARQFAELGLAGAQHPIGAGLVGAGTGWLSGDWRYGGLTFAALLSRRVAGRIDERVARRVGEMLASNDPQVLRNAFDMIARNQSLLNAVRRVESDLSKLSITNAPQVTPANMLPAAANQDQNNTPR